MIWTSAFSDFSVATCVAYAAYWIWHKPKNASDQDATEGPTMQNGAVPRRFLSSTWWQLLLLGQLNIQFFWLMHPFWWLRSLSRQRQVCGLLYHLCLITAFEPCKKCRTTWFAKIKTSGTAWSCIDLLCGNVDANSGQSTAQFTFRKHGQGQLQNQQGLSRIELCSWWKSKQKNHNLTCLVDGFAK